MKLKNYMRMIERKLESIGSFLYNSGNHENYYRNVMFFRSIFRKISGNELTNTIEQGRPLFEQISKIANYDGTQKVLDFGCGAGGIGYHFVNSLQPSGSYVGVDIFGGALAIARERLSPVGKSFSLHLINNSKDLCKFGKVDIVVAQSVFTHCPIELFEEFLTNLRNSTHEKTKIICNFAIAEKDFNISNIDYVFRRTTVESSINKLGYNVSEILDWKHPANSVRSADKPKDCCFLITP